MKFKKQLCLGLILASVITVSGCSKKTEEKKPEEKTATEIPKAQQEVVATVNGQPIKKYQLYKFLHALNQGQGHDQTKKGAEAAKATEKDALKRLVNLELLYQESQANDITVSKEEIDKVIDSIKNNFPNEKIFKEALAKDYTSEDFLREDIKKNLAVEHFVAKKIVPSIEVTEKESRAFYEEKKQHFQHPEGAHIRHILVRLEEKASDEENKTAKGKIENIKKQLDEGKDFAELATTNSDCPSAKKGGDLGYISKGQTVPEFEKCAFELEKPGQISDIVKTKFGYHILKLEEEKRPAGVVSFEEAKKDINQYLQSQKVGKELESYVDKLFANAKIESEIEL